MHAFPIPVVALVETRGPGSQPEDESLNYMDMPHDMRTYRMPVLPEPEEVRDLRAARGALQAVLAALQPEQPPAKVDLSPLDAANLALIDQIMGEGEVSALIETQGGSLRIQESVFAGVWRVRMFDADAACIADHIEIGDLPAAIVLASRAGLSTPTIPTTADGVINAPALLAEITEHLRLGACRTLVVDSENRPQRGRFLPDSPPHGCSMGQEAGEKGSAAVDSQPTIPKSDRLLATPYHIINLSLLPFSPEDAQWLDQALGRGTVSLLSRGYGNCRITATGISRVWWVQYFNSQDALILNTLEITDAPEVARAAAEDLTDSGERLTEVLEWIG
jgi:hydrogenase-1 operon protein HyaF